MTAPAVAIPPTWEPPPVCCVLGTVYFAAFARAVRSLHTGVLPERQAAPLIASQLVEVVDHLVTMHDAAGDPVDGCEWCATFDGPPGPDVVRARPGLPPPIMSASDWAKEGRAHRVGHTFLDGRLRLAT